MTGMHPLAGLALPFRITGGRVATAEDTTRPAGLRHLLTTRVRERVLRGDYGGGMHQSCTRRTTRRSGPAAARRRLALRNHLPQLRLAGPVQDVHGEGWLRVLIDYRLNPVDVVRSLEIPLATPNTGRGGVG